MTTVPPLSAHPRQVPHCPPCEGIVALRLGLFARPASPIAGRTSPNPKIPFHEPICRHA